MIGWMVVVQKMVDGFIGRRGNEKHETEWKREDKRGDVELR